MNHEEKASELILKIFRSISQYADNTQEAFEVQAEDYNKAKSCAIICVDEILNNRTDIITYDENMCKRVPLLMCDILYWQSVKQSIINQ